MASELPDGLRELAWSQDGLLTSRQALAGGLSREAIKWRLGAGHWQRLHTGVYGIFSGPPGRRAILWAAALRAGPGAMLSYHTAAELAALTDRPGSLIHVTLPSDRVVKPIPGVVLHRSARAARALHPALVPPRTRVEETVLDLAGAAADGVITLRYSWLDVSQQPCLVAAQVAQVLRLRGYAGARGCSPACPVSAMILKPFGGPGTQKASGS